MSIQVYLTLHQTQFRAYDFIKWGLCLLEQAASSQLLVRELLGTVVLFNTVASRSPQGTHGLIGIPVDGAINKEMEKRALVAFPMVKV